jgi:hypothetical protein
MTFKDEWMSQEYWDDFTKKIKEIDKIEEPEEGGAL